MCERWSSRKHGAKRAETRWTRDGPACSARFAVTPLERAATLHHRAIEYRARGAFDRAALAAADAADLFERADGRGSLDAAHARVEWAEIAETRGDLAGA